jgi:arylsulfatase A-like enzyme
MTECVTARQHGRRRKAMQAALALLLSAACLAGCDRRPPAVQNLVLICIDTVRADAFFSQRIDDPLALRLQSAQQYRNASSAAPWTIPSVASIMTGLYPVQHNAGQFRNQPANLDVEIPSALGDSALTLAEILHDQDFRSAAFSAHPWMAGKFGLQQGFDQVRLFKGWKKLTEHLTEWLDEDVRPQRFFAYVHLMEAHDWHKRSQQERDAFLAAAGPDLREQLRADTNPAACVDPDGYVCQTNLVYNLAVREVRTGIDHVLQELEKRDLLNDTLVIVYSDHGEEFLDHEAEDRARGGAREIFGFGHGQSLYQELLHVPLLVWHPGIKGAVRNDLVSLVDVLPSTLSWLGIEHADDSLPGKFLPAGTDDPPADAEPRVVFASGIAYGPEQFSAREGETKSILYYPGERFEYFDLSADPQERAPLQDGQLTMRFDVLTGDYLDLRRESLAAGPELDAQTLEQLKSIGYLQGVEQQGSAQTMQSSGEEAGQAESADDGKPVQP